MNFLFRQRIKLLRKKRRSVMRDTSGAAAIEFAISLPLYLSALFLVIECGRLAYSQAALIFAAQEATRFAIVREGQLTDEEIRDFAASKLIGLNEGLAVVTVQSPFIDSIGASSYTVNISYNFRPIAPYLPSDLITLSASSSGFIAFPPSLPGAS